MLPQTGGTQTVPKAVTERSQKGPVKFEVTGAGEIAERKPVDGEEVAVLKTNRGRIVLMFFPDKAPNHVQRFKDACNQHIFDGVTFHRVIPNFVIQGGDPNSKDTDRTNDGEGGWGDPIKAEFNDISYVPGILGAARDSNPDSATTQFFIMHGTAERLNGKYTAYGKVIEGMKVVDTIVNLPRDKADNPLKANPAVIYHATVVKWPVK